MRRPGWERWRTQRAGPLARAWETADDGTRDEAWARAPAAGHAREALQQGLLFPAARFVARPSVHGAGDLEHVPQPAVLAANHASDLDTPLVLAALPRAWRTRTVVGAAADRFYRRRRYAVSTALWIGTFPFERGGEGHGLARAATLLGEGWNVLLYPQATRSHGELGGFRRGVGRLCVACGVPAVPVHVGGTALLMPKGRGLSQRGRTSVTFGRPLHAAPAEAPDMFAERLARAVGGLAR